MKRNNVIYSFLMKDNLRDNVVKNGILPGFGRLTVFN